MLVAARIDIVERAVLIGTGSHASALEPRPRARKRHSEELILCAARIFTDREVRHIVTHRMRLFRAFSHIESLSEAPIDDHALRAVRREFRATLLARPALRCAKQRAG